MNDTPPASVAARAQTDRAGDNRDRPRLLWVVLWSCLLASPYLPMLSSRFDFIDDGNLVYPAPPMSFAERVGFTWRKVVANYEHLGPFRPALWAHWELQADLFDARAINWRAARLGWMTLSLALFLWWLRELGIRPSAAVFTAALAWWNPYRNEVWRSLTLSEGVAMPYMLLALIAATRAARSRRSLAWDIVGVMAALVALGCKNTFAAIVPAQVFLRAFAAGDDWRTGLRRHGRRAALLLLPLALPIAHYVVYESRWHAGQYVAQSPSWMQLGRLLHAILGAVSIDFIGIGLAAALLAVLIGAAADSADESRRPTPTLHLRQRLAPYRVALIAAAALLIAGVAVYLPIAAVAGRYTIPAVWGADLLIAILLSLLATTAPSRTRRLALIVLSIGLAAVAIANFGKQQKFAARAALLWNVLEDVERNAPTGACIAWVDGPHLNVEEGIHFLWHLRARGRSDLAVRLLDGRGAPIVRAEAPEPCAPETILISGDSDDVPQASGWSGSPPYRAPYWLGTREHACYRWTQGR